MEEAHDSGLEAAVAELRVEVRHLSSGLADLRQDLRSDIAVLRQEMRSDIGELRQEMRSDMDELRQEMRSDMDELRQEMRSDIGELRQDDRRLDARLFQLLVTQVATLATALGALLAAIAS